jgi:hypothetical protein
MRREEAESGRLSRYLLGALSEADTEALEREYFTQTDCFDSLEAAEDQLIDDYVQGRLTEADRIRFEERILATADGQARVELARSLLEVAGRASPLVFEAGATPRALPSTARRSLLAAGLAAAVLAAGAWAVWSQQVAREAQAARQAAEQRGQELAARLARLEQAAEAQRRSLARLTEELALERVRRPIQRLFSVVLTPGLERGPEGPVRLVLPAAIEEVRLRLLLARDSSATYTATVETPEGRQLARWDGLHSEAAQGGRALDVTLPAKILTPGTYIVMLQGEPRTADSKPLDAYYFEVAAAP